MEGLTRALLLLLCDEGFPARDIFRNEGLVFCWNVLGYFGPLVLGHP